MTTTTTDRHEEDREFLQTLRTLTMKQLDVYIRFQSCEEWRRIAIQREIERRYANGEEWV